MMKYCPKCKKTLRDDMFYTTANGDKTELCKKCLTMHIDNFDTSTFLWVLEKLDVPYIEPIWNDIRDKKFAKNPNKMNGMSVLGRYLSLMSLKQHKNERWADTERIQAELEKAKVAAEEEQRKADALYLIDLEDKLKRGLITDAEFLSLKRSAGMVTDEELKEAFEKGEISESEYKTLASTEQQYEDFVNAPVTEDLTVGENNAFNENNYLPADKMIDLGADLTDDEKIALALKWGRQYLPSEWVQLEKIYTDMKNSFSFEDADTENSLKFICKNNLKMNQAIDSGDYDAYLKLSRINDAQRKSAKFTAAQNKEDKKDFVDCVGTLVAYCEKEGGKIPRYQIETDYDIIDTVINDLKTYLRKLVYEDKALARQVEEYLQRLQNKEDAATYEQEAKEKGIDAKALVNDEDHMKYLEMLAEEKNQDEELINGA